MSIEANSNAELVVVQDTETQRTGPGGIGGQMKALSVDEVSKRAYDKRLNPFAPEFVPRVKLQFDSGNLATKILNDVLPYHAWSAGEDISCGREIDSIWQESSKSVTAEPANTTQRFVPRRMHKKLQKSLSLNADAPEYVPQFKRASSSLDVETIEKAGVPKLLEEMAMGAKKFATCDGSMKKKRLRRSGLIVCSKDESIMQCNDSSDDGGCCCCC